MYFSEGYIVVVVACSAYSALIYRVDKRDEASSQVSRSMGHAWNFGDDESLVPSHQLEIVRRTGWPPTELSKLKQGCLSAGARHHNVATPDAVGGRTWWVILEIAQELEPIVGVGSGGLVQREMIDP